MCVFKAQPGAGNWRESKTPSESGLPYPVSSQSAMAENKGRQ